MLCFWISNGRASTMLAKLADLVKRKSSTSSAASSSADAAPAVPRLGPTGQPLPPCNRPLIAYLGSPYGVAPDFVGEAPVGVGQPMGRQQLAAHIAKLAAPVGEPYGGVQFDGFDVEFKHLESLEAARSPAADYSHALAEPNVLKNRYGNILPPEHSRVRLSEVADDDNADFINANFVDGLCAAKRYIATQGPLPNTFADFWRMVWEQEVAVILMLTREIESGVIKCARYWPEPDDENDDDDDDDAPAPVVAKLSDEQFVAFDDLPPVEPADADTEDARQQSYGDVRVLFRGKRLGDEFVVRQFDLRRGSVVRRLTMLQYTGWPDHGVPASPQGFVTLSRLADLANKSNTRANYKLAGRKRHEAEKKRSALPPLLAHCSAGVGRTGTFITIHSLLERVKQAPDEPLSVHQTLYMIRGARPNSVQTKDQYRFCYLSVEEQIRQLDVELTAAAAAAAAADPHRSKRAAHRAKKKQRLELPAAAIYVDDDADDDAAGGHLSHRSRSRSSKNGGSGGGNSSRRRHHRHRSGRSN